MRAVLFDADGVVQRTMSDWRTMLSLLIPPEADIDTFMSDFFKAEVPSLVGTGNLEGSRPDDLIFIDDNVRNIEAAIALGINALCFNSASGTSALVQYLSEMGII